MIAQHKRIVMTMRKRTAAAYVVYLTVLFTAIYFLAPVTVSATGRVEVRRESVCVHSYPAGVKGGTHQQCDQWKTVEHTYCEYRFTNAFKTWTSFGGCTK